MEKICGIYYIFNTKTNKYYIGSSVDIKRRFNEHKKHLKYNNHVNPHLQSTYNKYGLNALKFNILEQCEESLLEEKENYYINKYKSNDSRYGYNIAIAYHGKMKQEVKDKISKSNKGRVFSEEHKRKLSESHKGMKAWNKGLHIRTNKAGYKHSPEIREKISQAIKNSPNYKNISNASKNRDSWCKGLTKDTDERVRKISESVKKSWEKRRMKDDACK